MRLQRVRIVCISDTHNQTPQLPAGDVLIHAGDLTRQGTPAELQRAFHWLDDADFRVKIVIAGNHDLGLDRTFQQPGNKSQTKEQIEANIRLFKSVSNLHYLQHESRIIRLYNGDGSEVRFKVFGSPYSPHRGKCAFSYTPSAALTQWDAIPLDCDVVVTHTPAKYHLDESNRCGAAGCERLRQTLWRVRPRLFVPGHIHEAYGAEVVEWDLDTPNVSFKERSARIVEDEKRAKNTSFCIDLSSKAHVPLRNDGSKGDLIPVSARRSLKGIEVKNNVSKRGSDLDLTMGRGGRTSDLQVDQEALAGRRGRRQTCIINAAYLGGRGGKHVNKPIVIDIDLPVSEGRDEWYVNAVMSQMVERNER